MLHGQPSSKDPARKSGQAILGLRYFGPAKVVKERIGGGRAADFVAFHCTGQEKAAHGQRGLRGARGVKNGVTGVPKTAAVVPEMSRCGVE
jgi:hypothetical protein